MVEPVSAAKGAIEVAGALMKTAGETPEVKEAGKNLGQAAVTVTRTINNALLPLAALNFGIDKARAYFADRFARDMEVKAAAIPPEEIVDPKPSVAGPALQGLAFTHDEPDLKAMYLSLLATAMDKRVSKSAHPAFVEIIRQIDASEVALLRPLLSRDMLPIVEINRATGGPLGHYNMLVRHYAGLIDPKTGEQRELPEFPAMVDNWIRLGLVDVSYERFMTDEGRYSWVEERTLVKQLKAEHERDGSTIEILRGTVMRTAFGLQFAQAVGMFDSPAAAQVTA
ncbi:DUF4393 domain-containing protein [Caballeronia sp. INDeC2]|uniref:DUF4393 domain-containing protein n=1 Tax=Caballeronia sp. INDeC2 TaxID=2921747 RepID=UPI0020290831|nr:DUF4393 domain-containing protein [Caballeronia sp. INDeC2]